MKKGFITRMIPVIVISFLATQGLQAQTLGGTMGNSLLINTMSGASGNVFSNRSWLLRDANGSDWLTARLHDGIDIDNTHMTPQVNTRTWWERDPYNDIQSWGHGNLTYLTVNAGRIGIGTATPVSRLNIVDPAQGWVITSRAQATAIGHINGIKLLSGYENDNNKWAGIASVAEDQHSNATGLALYAGQIERVRISYSGNVGIGTVTPAEKLSVNGNIRAKEVKVETANWPDYVFASDYKLPDLKDTEVFIKANKHLPGMPSAATVEKEGVNLGEINRKLLEKVEELTLHLIEKQKETEEVKTIIKTQEDRIADLEEKYDELKFMILKINNPTAP